MVSLQNNQLFILSLGDENNYYISVEVHINCIFTGIFCNFLMSSLYHLSLKQVTASCACQVSIIRQEMFWLFRKCGWLISKNLLQVNLQVASPLDPNMLNGAHLGLDGEHQFVNAGLAVALCSTWLQRTGHVDVPYHINTVCLF